MVSPNEVWARTGSKSVAINKYRINDLIFSMVHSRDASRRPAEPINLEREECPFQLPTQDTAQQPGRRERARPFAASPWNRCSTRYNGQRVSGRSRS